MQKLVTFYCFAVFSSTMPFDYYSGPLLAACVSHSRPTLI